MWDMNPRKVLVAVDGDRPEAALTYAVGEAVRRGCGIHVVHVARPTVLDACAPDEVVMVGDALQRVGMAQLAAAAARTERLLHDAAPDDDRLSVSSELTHGSVVASLVSLSQHACLLVLAHRGMGPTGETSTLSVVAGVAAQSHCPVVAVPDDWRVPARPTALVVVGMDVLRPSSSLISCAMDQAARSDSRLRVVHAWQPTPGASPEEQTDAQDRVKARMAEIVAGPRSVAPTLSVELALRVGPAARVLRTESGLGDLVVVGRHHRKHVVGAHLGGTARELLRFSRVPVMVVDPVGEAGSRQPNAPFELTRS